jgi:D-xylose transport system substrate-binding protein
VSDDDKLVSESDDERSEYWDEPRGFTLPPGIFEKSLNRGKLVRTAVGTIIGGAFVARSGWPFGTGTAAAATTSKKPTVAFLYDDFANPRYIKGDVPGFLAEAKKLGLNTIVEGVSNNEIEQENQVTQVLTRGIQCLVLSATNNDTAPRMVKEARASGVPVISYNTLILGVKLSAYIARDSTQVGVELAQAAVKAEPQGNYVVVLGDPSYDVARMKAAGNMKVLTPLVNSGKIKIVSQQWNTGWSAQSAQTQVEQALTKANNNVQVVLSSNDGMALGALAALKAQGLDKKVFITGEDAQSSFVSNFESGVNGVSNWTVYNVMGAYAAKAAYEVVNHLPVKGQGLVGNGGPNRVPWFKPATLNVTPQNVAEFFKKYPWYMGS